MKIRNGFVSNSSSSSFCIFGIDDFSINDPVEFIRVLKTEFPNDFKKFIEREKRIFDERRKEDRGYGKVIEWAMGDTSVSPYKSHEVRGCEHPITKEVDGADSNFCPICGKPTWIKEDIVCEADVEEFANDDIRDLFDSFPDISYISADGVSAIGLNYRRAPDDMTFGDFRKKANRIVSKIVGRNVECSHICRDYYC